MQGNEPLIIWGAGGHAKVVAEAARLSGRFEVTGFIDEVNPQRKGQAFADAVVLGGAEVLDTLPKGRTRVVVAVGDCAARLQIAERLYEQGWEFATVIHPRAFVSSEATIGPGTVVAAGAVVNPGAVLGAHVILNTGCTVDHDCVIGDGVHIGPGAHLGGHVHVERGAWIGIGATLKDRIRIGTQSIIGAGAVVVKDIPAGVVAFGVPARVVRNVQLP